MHGQRKEFVETINKTHKVKKAEGEQAKFKGDRKEESNHAVVTG
jgi:hypothetical protein